LLNNKGGKDVANACCHHRIFASQAGNGASYG